MCVTKWPNKINYAIISLSNFKSDIEFNLIASPTSNKPICIERVLNLSVRILANLIKNHHQYRYCTDPQNLDFLSNFLGLFCTSKKYSVDFKFKVAQEYLQGGLSTKLLARKYDISSKSLVTKWINQYQQFGEAGLRHQRTKQQYSLNFKLDVLSFNQDTGPSYKETENSFDIKEPSIIANWKRTYVTEGAKGLNKPQGSPPRCLKKRS